LREGRGKEEITGDGAKIEEVEDAAAWRTEGGAALRRRVPAHKFAPP